jgi:hypothetical protein
MKSLKRVKARVITFSVVAVAVTIVATASIAAAHDDDLPNGLGAVRKATAAFRDLKVATDSSYGILKDKDGIACIDNPGVGAMGVHYVNGDLVASGKVDALHPQALVYEPAKNGRLHLVAVEYVTFQAAWDESHTSPPTLFVVPFMLTPEGNRFGLPAFYSLHAWAWKSDPLGRFSMWNPRVHCGTTHHGESMDDDSMDMGGDH